MPTTSLPCSLADLLKGLRPCFTAPTFRTFQALVGGFLAQPGLRTVTGMLVGARLAGRWHHARAHRFFAAARWSADQLGLLVCDLIVDLLLSPDAPIVLVVDDSLFKRTGRKIHGAGWRYDATATGRTRTAWATPGWCSAYWWRCRWWPTGGCACRSARGCGSPAGRASWT
jgi:hypothetical protein